MSSYVLIMSRAKWAERFGKARKNLFVDPGCYDKADGSRMQADPRNEVCAPLAIISDIPAHMAPSGAYISGRKAMMDDCRAHGYVPYEPVNSNPGGLTDPATAKAAGKKVCEKTQEWLATQKARYTNAATNIT